jgi:hypothetical protein
VGKTGQMARNLTKIRKIFSKSTPIFQFWSKYPGFGQILKPKSGQKNDLLLQRFLT